MIIERADIPTAFDSEVIAKLAAIARVPPDLETMRDFGDSVRGAALAYIVANTPPSESPLEIRKAPDALSKAVDEAARIGDQDALENAALVLDALPAGAMDVIQYLAAARHRTARKPGISGVTVVPMADIKRKIPAPADIRSPDRSESALANLTDFLTFSVDLKKGRKQVI